jgi:uncharacterized protein
MRSNLSRRTILTRGALGGATLALASVLSPAGAHAGTARRTVGNAASGGGVRLADGPYGPLSTTPDANGFRLPPGFTSRVVASAGERVGDSDYEWHQWPDGGACFATDDGGWVYVSNSEIFPFTGGVGAIRFGPDGEIVDAYRILDGTNVNCAGGPTPWGTWLSCEEFDLHDEPELAELAGVNAGQVWECDPFGPGQGEVRPAMGVFQHEAAAVDPVGRHVYLTEDLPNGLFYRFTPASYPDLSEGLLEAASVVGDEVSWVEVPDPLALAARPSDQLGEAATQFRGGEGIWYHEGFVYFTTKGDDRVHALEAAADRYEVLYDPVVVGEDAPLRGVDNLTVEEGSGDIYVAEDGGDMEVVLLTPEREMTPFLALTGQDQSELAGPAFDPSGTRLYVSSQKGPAGGPAGMTYEITGPFRGPDLLAAAEQATGAAPTTVADTLRAAGRPGGSSNDGGLPAGAMVVGAVVAGAAAAGALALRRRGARTPDHAGASVGTTSAGGREDGDVADRGGADTGSGGRDADR